MKSEFTGKKIKGWDLVGNPDGPDYLNRTRHGISINVHPKGAGGTTGHNRDSGENHSKKGKPGKYLWEIWYDNLVAHGYASSLMEAMKDSLYSYTENCEASVKKVKLTKTEAKDIKAASVNPHLEELAEQELPGLRLRITKDKNQFNKKGDILEVQHCEDNVQDIDFHSPMRCTTTNPAVDKDDIWQIDWLMEGLGDGQYLEVIDNDDEEDHMTSNQLVNLYLEAEEFENEEQDEDEAEADASLIEAAEKLYSYKVVTHGKFSYYCSDAGQEEPEVQAEPDEAALQEAIDEDWEEFDEALGLGEFLSKDEFKKTGFMDKVRKLFKLEDRMIEVQIPAPIATIQSDTNFTLNWEIQTNVKLNAEQEKALLGYIQGQCSDGWGEGFEQHPFEKDLDCSFECYDCKGDGKVECPDCDGEGELENGEECTTCDGDRTVDCESCDGGAQEGYCEVSASPWDRDLTDKDTIQHIQK